MGRRGDEGTTNGDRDQDGCQWRGHDDEKNEGTTKAPVPTGARYYDGQQHPPRIFREGFSKLVLPPLPRTKRETGGSDFSYNVSLMFAFKLVV